MAPPTLFPASRTTHARTRVARFGGHFSTPSPGAVLAPSLLLALALLPSQALAASIVVTTGGPYTVVAGASVTMTAYPTASTTCTGRLYRWDFNGDGTYDTTASSALTATFTATGATYDGPTTYTTVVEVTSAACGITATGSTTLSITNADPTISSTTITNPVAEGVAQTMVAAYADVETHDTQTVAWNFGDGTTGTGASVSKTFADNGTYAVSVTVTDDDGGSVSSSTNVTVTNVAPATGTQSGTASTAEGSSVSRTCSATDVASDSVTWGWTWGDGTTSTSASTISGTTSSTTATHSYADEGGGTYTVTCTASDEDGGSSSAVGTVGVTNAAPVASAGGSTSASEGVPVTYACSALDPGTADTVSYTWVFSDSTTGSGATVLHTWADDGSYSAQCVATDNDGLAGTSSVSTTVNNVAPLITSATASAASTNEGTALSFTCLATDVASDTLSYLWTFGDGSSSTTSSPSHAFTDEGVFTAACTVSDDNSGSSSSTTRVTVSNLSPTIGAYTIPSSGTEGTAVSFSASATDPGSDTLTYRWTFGDGAVAAGTTASHTYTDNGTYSITLTVDDGDGGSDSRTQSIIIANGAPVISELYGDQILDEGESGDYGVSYTDAGSSDLLTVSWDFGDGTTDTGIDGTDHVYADDGDYEIEVTICDDDGACVTETLTVEVSNVAPVVTSLAGDTAGDEGDSFAFLCAATDAGGDSLTYILDYGDGSSEASNTGTHVYVDDGTYTVTCLVDDGDEDGLTSETLEVEVANVAPTLVMANTSVSGDEGTEFAFEALATDPGDDVLTYTWDFGDGAVLTGESVAYAWADEGTYTVTLTITDGDGGEVTTSGTAVIANAAPSVSLTAPASGDEGVALEFDATVVEPGSADTVTCVWDWGDGTTEAWTGDTTHSWEDEGSFVVTLTCEDNDGGVSSESVTVTVENAPPTITGLSGDTTGHEGDTYEYSVSAEDSGANDTFTVSWDWGDGTTGSGEDASHTYTNDGTYTVTVTVTDNDGGTSTETMTVVVTNVDPVIDTISGTSSGHEGEALPFSASASDVGSGDVLTYTWDWGDGLTSTGDSVTHAWGDNGSFTVVLSVYDGTATVVQSLTVDTDNVDPEVAGTPADNGYVGGAYTFAPTASDPGTLDTFTWTGSIPASASLDATTGALRWTPRTADIGVQTLSLTVTDDDGGSGTLEWEVEVTFHDRDGDGLPDEWEDEHGLDADDPSDAHGDPDADGRDNTEEYTDGTLPEVYDGPTAPIAYSPDDGSEVAGEIALVVENATSPLDEVLTYEFDLYDDEDMTSLVDSTIGYEEDASGFTSWTIREPLSENTWYYWEAAADDGWVTSAFTEPYAFFFNSVNDPPSAPSINNPFDGSSVSDLSPTLVLDASVDPDEDVLSYGFMLTDTVGNEIAATVGVPQTGETAEWTVDVSLTDGDEYCWRGWAKDDEGLTSPDSDTACFTVDTSNRAPSSPEIISPEDGSAINTPIVDIVLTDGVDPEARGLQHIFQIDTEANFSSIDYQTGTVLSDGSGTTTWTTGALHDDKWYHVRALASDGAAYSDWATSTFFVKIGNHIPEVPVLISPEDGALVAPGTALVVENVVDADDDSVVYDFIIFDDNGDELAHGEEPEDISGATTWTPDRLPLGDYTWQARAIDIYGFTSPWADPWAFTVDDAAPCAEGEKFCDTGTLMGGGCGCAVPGNELPLTGAWLVVGAAVIASRRRR